ncbi:universal stress protein [Streptomyces sp. G45]|uniref:universal stress protein n=1 Tax=Streptomyces sp. G45 TaxID=3406627 RepID=UPI003C27E31E
MIRPITVGVDGSPESRAAADWAAREARRRALPLRLVQAWVWRPPDVPAGDDHSTQKRWALRVLDDVEREVRDRHPDLPLSTQLVSETVTDALLAQSNLAELLVLGSSGHGAVTGFLLGSVGHQVLAHATRPVVMVRGEPRGGPRAAGHEDGDVVLGVQEPGGLPAPLLEFAFEAADARAAGLRVVHAPKLPPLYGYGPAVARLAAQDGCITGQARTSLTDALQPWREKYPRVPVSVTVELAHASGVLLEAAARAALVVVGRAVRRPVIGMRIGPVTHAVLHHAAAPVAVVPHD